MRAHGSLRLLVLSTSLLGVLAGAPAAEAAPVALAITSSTSPPPVAVIPFEAFRSGSVTVDVGDVKSGEVELYDLMIKVGERADKACRLPVKSGRLIELSAATAAAADASKNTNCRSLLPGKLSRKVGVSVPGSTAYGVLSFEVPLAYTHAATAVTVQKTGKPSPQIDWPWTIPANVRLLKSECYLFAGAWREASCAGGQVNPDQNARSAVESSLFAAGGSAADLVLVAFVIDANADAGGVWRSLKLDVKEAAPKPTKGPDFDLEKTCKAQIAEDMKKLTAVKGGHYVICADVQRAAVPVVTTWMKHADGSVERVDDFRLGVNVPVTVYAWHKVSSQPSIEFAGGSEGVSTTTYVPPTKLVQGRGADDKPDAPAAPEEVTYTRKDFAPRKGPSTTLTITLKSGAEAAVVVTHGYSMESLYRTAFRVGIGAAWSPWARDVAIRTAADGRRYSAISGGDGAFPGLVNMELIIGYSIFARPIREFHADDTVGFNFGLGVLRAGANVDALSSLRFGVEWAHGLDFSLMLSAGLNRHDQPTEAYKPGLAIPASAGTSGTIEKSFGVTPGFGLVMNLSPAFFKVAGIPVGGP